MTIERSSLSRRVCLVSDPTRIGVLTGREQMRRNRRLLQVQFPDTLNWIPESQIQFLSERLSPLDMLESKRLGRPIDLRRTLTHVKLSGRLADVIYSMEATNTDFYAYQFKPVIKILESPSNGILIADEVGLGKTIEAGLIWTELRSRFDMRRLVVLCPAALREKWRRELSTKIGVTAHICDARQTLDWLQDPEAGARGFAIVASIQGLRPVKEWEDERSKRATAELARFLQSMESEDHLLDLLVIDEAHHLRNSETQNNELGRLFRKVSAYTTLLTATPIHNRNDDLFALLQILDPDTFTRQDVLSQVLSANAPLVKARDLVLTPNFDIQQLRALIEEARSHPLLSSNRQLSMVEESELNETLLEVREARSRLAYRLETVNLLAHVVTRTRKRDVNEWRVIREPIPEFADLAPIEERFYQLVTEVVIKYASERNANERFLLAQPQRQMSSSMAAALRCWQRRLIELEETEATGDDEVDDQTRTSLGPLATEIVSRSHNYVELNLLIEADTKYRRFREVVRSYLSDFPTEKIVVFSTFRATLEYLSERLTQDGVSSITLMGGQSLPKDDIITQFRNPSGPCVLLSSEVGGEGVDLQFSRVVINYDLPWNPMRLEQRIGRVDRLGQGADRVFIWNMLLANTIDARIYQRLFEKLELCQTALGDFEAILGDEIRRLESDLLSAALTPEQQERRIDQTAQALENLRQEERRLEQEATHLVAYGDYILNQVQAARELNRWVDGNDLRRYVLDYLRLHYPGCDLHQIEPDSLSYDISLSEMAKFDLTEFIRSNRLSTVTRLITASSGPVRCHFDNRVTQSTRRAEEIVSQFHPLVRMISSHIKQHDEQLTPAVALSMSVSDVGAIVVPGVYVLAAALWTFRGLQDIEKLSYAASPLGCHDDYLDPEDAEKLAMLACEKGADWLDARNEVDLDAIYDVANESLFDRLDDQYEEFKRSLNAKNHDRADIQLRTLEQHLDQQVGILKQIRDKHSRLGRESLAKATEGRILALNNRVKQRRMKIESGRSMRAQSQEIALAVIMVKP